MSFKEKFISAVNNDDAETVKTLLSNQDESLPDISTIMIDDDEKENALHTAAFNNNVELTKILLEHISKNNINNEQSATTTSKSRDAFLNAKNKNGVCPIALAVFSKNSDLVSLFLNTEGVRLDVVDENNANLIVYCSFGGDVKNAKLILEKVNSESIADFVNQPCRDSTTALHKAVINPQNADFINFLLENGAKLNALDYQLQSPLFHCALGGSAKIVRLLLEKGASLDVKNISGVSLEDEIVGHKRMDVIEVISSFLAEQKKSKKETKEEDEEEVSK